MRAMKELARANELTGAELFIDTRVTDAGLKQLNGDLTQLTSHWASGVTNVTDLGLKDLKEAQTAPDSLAPSDSKLDLALRR